MQRGFYSIFNNVYGFVQREPASQPQVPNNSRNELPTALLLSPLLAAGWTALRARCQLLQTPRLGFGARCTPHLAASVRRMERRGDYVRLSPGPRPRQNPQRHLAQADFKTVISTQAKFRAHSGVLEPTRTF